MSEKIKHKIILPEDLSEVKLSRYIRLEKELSEIAFDKDSKEYRNKSNELIFRYILNLDINLIAVHEIDAIISHLNLMMGKQYELVKYFTYKDVKYGFENDMYNLKYKVWLDIQDLLNSTDPNKELKILSILYRPITNEEMKGDELHYDIEEYNGSHEQFHDLPTNILFGFRFFFSRLLRKSTMHFQVIIKELKRNNGNLSKGLISQLSHLSNNSTMSKEDLQNLTNYLEMISQNMNIS